MKILNIENQKEIISKLQNIGSIESFKDWVSFMCMSQDNTIIDRVIFYEMENYSENIIAYIYKKIVVL